MLIEWPRKVNEWYTYADFNVCNFWSSFRLNSVQLFRLIMWFEKWIAVWVSVTLQHSNVCVTVCLLHVKFMTTNHVSMKILLILVHTSYWFYFLFTIVYFVFQNQFSVYKLKKNKPLFMYTYLGKGLPFT